LRGNTQSLKSPLGSLLKIQASIYDFKFWQDFSNYFQDRKMDYVLGNAIFISISVWEEKLYHNKSKIVDSRNQINPTKF